MLWRWEGDRTRIRTSCRAVRRGGGGLPGRRGAPPQWWCWRVGWWWNLALRPPSSISPNTRRRAGCFGAARVRRTDGRGRNLPSRNARGRIRTCMGVASQGILSPLRLPISPPGLGLSSRSDWTGHQRQPPVAIGHLAAHGGEVALLELPGDGAAPTLADLELVHAAEGRHLRRGAGHEHLIRRVQHLARDGLLAHRDLHLARQREDGIPRDAPELGAVKHGREDDPVLDQEDVLAAALAQQPARPQRDRLGVAVKDGVHLDQLRVVVMARALG